MSTNTAPTTAPRPASTERRIAAATSLAPLTAGILAPLLNHDTALVLDLAYLPAATFTTASVMDWIPHTTYQQLPAGDILHRHRFPAFLSTLTTGVALGMGTFTGTQGADALLAGILNPLTTQGIVSLGWWATAALVPIKLRRILTRRNHRTPHATTHGVIPAKPTAPPPPQTPEQQILHAWGQHISHPDTGSHRGQTLRLRTISAYRWQGTITAPIGQTVTVTKDAISSVYRVPTEWITLKTGAHAGEANITVNLQPPAELDTSTLAGAWKKWAARKGGVMADTYLEDPQRDPNTGGEVAYVVAGENLDKLPIPDRDALAGALRKNTLLCSYSPVPGDPRRGEIRLMNHNPLQEGVPFPGTDVLKISEGGYIHIGRHVSGFPARIQVTDPILGARHLFIAGVTGSGKGGLVQIVALADHINGHAIIYGDPKGSSNPDVETMACYSGLGEDGVMGALRVAYALMQWRIAESARLKMKNFQATPERPWVRVILDEAHVPLSELDQHKKEARTILEALAAKARSLGIVLLIVNQAVNADKLGGSTALRMNVIQGGSLVMLRSDSGQQHLVTTGFEGVDPGNIPASWDVKRPLIYDETVAMKDPKSTFGLGYTLGPGGAAEMMRTFILESAAPHIDTNAIAYPADWPDWNNREEIAATPILGDSSTDEDGGPGLLFSSADLNAKKPASAKDKILNTLQGLADPLGIDTNYTHKDDIGRIAGVEGQTLANTLSQLVKTNDIHRGPNPGEYGLGPAPATNTAE